VDSEMNDCKLLQSRIFRYVHPAQGGASYRKSRFQGLPASEMRLPESRKEKIMVRIVFPCIASLLSCVSTARSQAPNVELRIKLINDLNGSPWKLTQVGLEGSPDYHELRIRTDEHGVATLRIQKKSTIFTHNTKQYVACADEPGGLVHNDFGVTQILSTGIVQPVSKPNRCRITSSIATPGELVIFVGPWELFEKILSRGSERRIARFESISTSRVLSSFGTAVRWWLRRSSALSDIAWTWRCLKLSVNCLCPPGKQLKLLKIRDSRFAAVATGAPT
jgi:hypothetical protein